MEDTESYIPLTKGFFTNRVFSKRKEPKFSFCFIVTSQSNDDKQKDKEDNEESSYPLSPLVSSSSSFILNNELLRDVFIKSKEKRHKKVHNVHLSQSQSQLQLPSHYQLKPKKSLYSNYYNKSNYLLINNRSNKDINLKGTTLSNFNSHKYFCLLSNSLKGNNGINGNKKAKYNQYYQSAQKIKPNPELDLSQSMSIYGISGKHKHHNYFKQKSNAVMPYQLPKLNLTVGKKLSLKSLSQTKLLKQTQ